MGIWQAVVFDLDDTLFPEREYVLGGFRAVASWAAERLPIPAERGYAELAGLFATGVRGDTFDRWLASQGQPPALVPELVAVYRAHRPILRPFPGIVSLLAALRTCAPLGLVSDGYLAAQRKKLAALDLGHVFDAIVFSDQLGRQYWKPSPRPFETVASLLGLDGTEIVYIADNPTKDFLGARAAGLSTIWTRHSGGDYVSLVPPTAAYAADHVVDTLPGLAALLEAHVVAGSGSSRRRKETHSAAVPVLVGDVRP